MNSDSIGKLILNGMVSDALQRSKNARQPYELKVTVEQFLKHSRQDPMRLQAALDVSASQVAIPHDLA